MKREMRNYLQFAIIQIAFVLLVSACRSDRTVLQTPQYPSAVIQTILLPTETQAPFHTSYVPVSPSPTTTANPSASGVQKRCLVEEEKKNPNGLPGSLIVYVPDEENHTQGAWKNTGSHNRLYLQSGQMRMIPSKIDGTFISAPAVSPDGTLLAYRSGSVADGDWLVIESNTGEVLQKIKWKATWKDAFIQRWVNNEQLILELVIIGQVPAMNYPLSVFNPFTGEERLLGPVEDIWDLCGLCPTWEEQSLTVYDPTLQYVVYPMHNQEENAIVLKKISNGEIITRLPNYNLETAPKWASNGEFFIDSAPSNYLKESPFQAELFRINTNGQVEQLTHLSLAFPNIFIFNLSLSPDLEQIVFVYEKDGEKQTYLAVYDDESQTVTDLCFSKQHICRDNAPIWSPDGRYLALEVWDENSDPKLVIADLKAGTFFEYSKKVYVYGWMK